MYQGTAAKPFLNGLDQCIEKMRADWKYVGVAVAVVQGDEVIHAQGFGARQVGKPDRIDPDTLFQVGSTTKAFAAAALGVLVDEGKVHWDDPVVDHLAGFQLQDPWLTRNITIRDLLAHRSGVPVSFYPFLEITDSDEAIRQLRYIAPETPFRDSFLYNNVLYAAAGKVVEAISGMAWGDFVKQRLFAPLQMNRSGASPYEFWDEQYVAPVIFGSAPDHHASADKARDRNAAMPHAFDETGSVTPIPWQSYDVAVAAGSMVSSAADMANWLILHLNEGRFKTEQILSKETVRELHATQNRHAGDKDFLFPLDATTEGYALGWWRARYHGHLHLSHSGGIIGFPAYAAFLPERKTGVIVLSNGPKVARSPYLLEYLFHKAIAFSIFDRLLGATPRDWSRELLTRMQATQREAQITEDKLSGSRLHGTHPALSLEHYTGIYGEEIKRPGQIEIRLESGGLALSFSGGNAYSAGLRHWHRDSFRLHPKPGVPDVLGPVFVTFNITPAGDAASMSVFGGFGGTFRRLK
jgi:CubicO group peptidase (beta-lactamase class C family)